MMPERDDDGFLLRWSRRKRGVEVEPKPADGQPGTVEGGGDATTPEKPIADPTTMQADPVMPEALAEEEGEEAVPPELADVDIEALDYDSDYTRFLKDGVPEALKRRALRQLWRSDPILANVDGLNDYDGDFTDAAMVVDVLKTVHKVGRGYLTDDDDDSETTEDDLDVGDGEDGDDVAQSDPLEPDDAEKDDGGEESVAQSVMDDDVRDQDMSSEVKDVPSAAANKLS